MQLIWQDWKTPADPAHSALSAYAAWWNEVDRSSGAREPSALASLRLSRRPGGAAGPRLVFSTPEGADDDLDQDADAAIADAYGVAGALVPLPGHAISGAAVEPSIVPALARTLTRTSVIVAVIDTSIALCHDRFRDAQGKSRVLAAWQMTAVAPLAGSPGAGRTSYGREVWQGEIDQALTAASGEEAAANRALGLVDYDRPAGSRELDLMADHGTQVMDLAAGFDAVDPVQAALATRLPILAVNLPSNRVLGGSGAFLEYFVTHAIEWVIDRADALWDASFPTEAGRGFPIVLNLSYGLAAGPKDGTMLLEKYVTRLLAERALPDHLPLRAPIRIALPAGNDNLERGHALVELSAARRTVDLMWRLPPEDDASSHAEIWLPPQPIGAVGSVLPVQVELIAPGAGEAAAVAAPAPGMTRDLRDAHGRLVGRMSARQAHDGPLGDTTGPLARQMYLLSIAPTYGRRAGFRTAPAGGWTIRLSQTDDLPRALHLFVQSERSLYPTGPAQRRSYFDDPSYRIHDRMGALQDTYDAAGQDQEPASDPALVQRKGSMNAIATIPGALVAGSHRGSDQIPAPWSASGMDSGPSQPGVSIASEDSVAHPGVLAAGNRSGSVVSVSGTSFASALATRRIAQDLLAWADTPVAGGGWTNDVLKAEAAAGSAPESPFPRKIGAGRLSVPPAGRLPRRRV